MVVRTDQGVAAARSVDHPLGPAAGPVLVSRIDDPDPAVRANAARHRELVAGLRARLATASSGPAAARQRHVARGKLSPRARVDARR
jgi:3-methylcrotonyl-CoA carboxylase beta subunit